MQNSWMLIADIPHVLCVCECVFYVHIYVVT